MSKIITRAQVLEKLNNKKSIIIDVRNPNEFENGSIPTAINVPLSNLEKAVFEKDSLYSDDLLQKVTKSLDAEIVVYCQSGKRAGMALVLLQQEPFQYKNVLNYEGSWSEWSRY